MAFLIGDQPGRKSKALVTLLPLIKMKPEYRRQGYEVFCAGVDSHYRKDGSCIHVDAVYAALKSDWHRGRLWFVPFGDPQRTMRRASEVVVKQGAFRVVAPEPAGAVTPPYGGVRR